ncbi:FMRFamide-related peptides-like [Venturia canescens]|uniref:FMRFamide-related peptides-like n=1 Tax=Venturia canescens TaxID=32260 RepID=UPI001C9CF9C9|nr:FMRFamide-related peptides-like [Venturia canescens]
MIGQAFVYGAAFTCMLVSGTILSPLMKIEPGSTLNLYKNEDGSMPSEYDYTIVKRGPQEVQDSPDSKERRSQMGSSFIRFGRGRMEGNLENADYTALAGEAVDNELDSRMARGRSDVIIRFGRAESKNFRSGVHRLTRSDLAKLLENGNNRHPKLFGQGNYRPPLNDRDNDVDRVSNVCSNLLSSPVDAASKIGDSGNPYVAGKLLRLCNLLGLGIVENDENNGRVVRSKIIRVLEDAQAESAKRE